MPVNYSWVDQQKAVIRMELVGAWKWSECEQIFTEIAEIMRQYQRRIDIIVDYAKSEGPPANLPLFSMTSKVLNILPTEYLGMIVLKNMPPLVVALRRGYVLCHPEYAQRLPVASTTEQAIEIIDFHRHRIA